MKLGFREDKRAVSALVGAILLLAILIIALSSYQAFIVPNQNAETEFDHNQQVEDEMVEFRNALLEARLDNRERAPSVKLGTRYQSRTLAVNPPPATGTLQSTGQNNNNISVNGTSADEDPIDFNLTGNQFFEYTPSYSEYRDAGTIRYENTLVYHDFGSDNVTLSNQRLLTGESPSGFDVDGTIRLVPSEPGIDEQGVDRVSYEPTPERARFVTVTDPEITLPTELAVESQDRTNWEDLLGGQIDEDEIREENGNLVLDLEGDYLIKYSFIGDPSGLPDDEREEDDNDGDDGANVNPSGEGTVVLINVDEGESSELEFRNRGSTRTVEAARVNFFIRVGSQGMGQPTRPPSTVSIQGGSTVPIGADFTEVDKEFLPGRGNTLTYEFNRYPNQDVFWVTTLLFEDGERATYFIGSTYEPSDPGE